MPANNEGISVCGKGKRPESNDRKITSAAHILVCSERCQSNAFGTMHKGVSAAMLLWLFVLKIREIPKSARRVIPFCNKILSGLLNRLIPKLKLPTNIDLFVISLNQFASGFPNDQLQNSLPYFMLAGTKFLEIVLQNKS